MFLIRFRPLLFSIIKIQRILSRFNQKSPYLQGDFLTRLDLRNVVDNVRTKIIENYGQIKMPDISLNNDTRLS